jgi:hypothetical protein
VKAGESVAVYVGVAGVEFTQPDHDGKRYALAGKCSVRFGLRETSGQGMGFSEHQLDAVQLSLSP